jgi:hypothetical protein
VADTILPGSDPEPSGEKKSSPKPRRKSRANRRIEVAITEENYARAVASDSGGCLIADALKEQGFSGVMVDMATIRVSDQAAGLRYYYLTPPEAQHVLLFFDQGWPNPPGEVVLRKPVKVLPITRARKSTRDRDARRAELEAKEARGEPLSRYEKSSLTNMRKHAARPSRTGPAKMTHENIVVGGRPLIQSPANPNLLRRNRIFGAKLAEPGVAFRKAVDEAVQLDREARESSTSGGTA